MPTKVHMEALSPTMEEGQLVRWLKNEGDEIKEGDVLAEIETDKATMELVARGAGVLRARMLNEGQTAPVGTVIGVIAGADEDVGELTGGAAKPAAAKKAAASSDASEEKPASKKPRHDSAAVKVAARGQTEQPREPKHDQEEADDEAEVDGADETAAADAGNGRGRVKASPLARRMAAESGVELAG